MKLAICITLLFATLIINSHVYSLSQSKESFQTLKENIQALDITREKSKKKLFTLDQIQDKILHNEYSVFIEYLSFRIKKYCSEISELYGEKLLNGLPCQFNKSQKIDENNYVTAEEQLQSLDDELLNALGNFDEMLLEEHEKIAQTQIQASKIKTSSKQSSSDGKNASNKESNQDQASEETQSQDGKSNKKENKQNQTQSKSKEDKQYKRRKIDKNDDDIVARQLKEAAENENDPELKEKLWDEYYKYKKNINKR